MKRGAELGTKAAPLPAAARPSSLGENTEAAAEGGYLSHKPSLCEGYRIPGSAPHPPVPPLPKVPLIPSPLTWAGVPLTTSSGPVTRPAWPGTLPEVTNQHKEVPSWVPALCH